ncbi:5-dehydro-4-deoxyglucarate dehydratase [Paenalcaligenes niemegkensis]|uniref:5-dehydro-4-deoxyglucarate dehydratase n=1 Tax=Paenalcaligenes niemegkensis TaxID=2895469 RepID=UPI001EE836F5|nr:5-dehydro-4-deoxyglucarate dehydratase [Paenalcaligenes niemegkensis]MCQ9617691.1 5-dehydro-4-deoxyglucarate dehydratase [Paenalcaligenes niemegkensis]
MSPQELKTVLSSGLLSFPVTDFDENLEFNRNSYIERLEWLAPYGASALFAAGGTGEGFSLSMDEYADVIRTAVDTCKGKVPILAGIGGNTRQAIQMGEIAQECGAAGVMLMPHYLTEASQDGVAQHVHQVCQALTIGVVVYNRNVCELNADHMEFLADRNSNLIGFKDGIGKIELMSGVRRRLGDRLTYLGGLPTAEVYAAAYRALGVPVYSSAAFNFVPRTAMEFYTAVSTGDTETMNRLLDDFYLPYVKIRNRGEGYGVSIVKAGARLVGHGAGPVRAPLLELSGEEEEMLSELITKQGTQ